MKHKAQNLLSPVVERPVATIGESWVAVAFERQVVFRALCMAMIVGTVLVTINHGISIYNCEFNFTSLCQSALTYVVPYTVSTISSVLAIHTTK